VDTGESKSHEREIMLHLIWYLIVGFIAGLVAKSAMHVHLPLLWTVVLGIGGFGSRGVYHASVRTPATRQFVSSCRHNFFHPGLTPGPFSLDQAEHPRVMMLFPNQVAIVGGLFDLLQTGTRAAGTGKFEAIRAFAITRSSN
jgi:hypothetical protein